jgi:hypothetical protein
MVQLSYKPVKYYRAFDQLYLFLKEALQTIEGWENKEWVRRVFIVIPSDKEPETILNVEECEVFLTWKEAFDNAMEQHLDGKDVKF